MCERKTVAVFGLSLLLSIPAASLCGQQRARVGGSPIGGSSIGGPPVSGSSLRNSPIANPAPSLSPQQVVHPKGSLSTGQVLNPEPSLNRPRSGGALPATSQPSTQGNQNADSMRPLLTEKTAGAGDGARPPMAAPLGVTSPVTPVGEQVLESVVDLDRNIEKVAPDKGWAQRLSLDALRQVPVFSEQPANDDQRTALEKILKTYQSVAQDEQSADINTLPTFKQTLESLQEYLSPIAVRRRKQALASFGQLKADLEWYKNGADWVKYLVPSELMAIDGKGSLSKDQLKTQLKRFTKVAGDPVYKKVTSLSGFQPAFGAIKAIADAQAP